MLKKKPVCMDCHSDDIVTDAIVEWNIPDQCWEIKERTSTECCAVCLHSNIEWVMADEPQPLDDGE